MALIWAKGKDVSTWQDSPGVPGHIDWSKPKGRGIKFVIHRATFGDAVDDDFFYNWPRMRDEGYLRGAYGFWDYRPGAASTAAQARRLVEVLRADPGEFPVVWMDFEQPLSTWPALPSRATCLEQIRCWMETVEDGLGVPAGIYTRPGHIKYNLARFSGDTCLERVPAWLAAKPLWVAAWPIAPDGYNLEGFIEHFGWRPNLYGQWADWLLWQYGTPADGKEMGFETGESDSDFFHGTEQELAALCGGKELPMLWDKNCLIAAFDPIGGRAPACEIDFMQLRAAGIHCVLLRCGQPDNKLNPDDPSAMFRDSATYGKWFYAATAAGLRVLVEYPFSPILDSVNGYNGVWSLRYLDYLLSGGKQPVAGGGLILTCESNTWLEGGDNHKVTCTSNMYGQDLRAVFDQVWTKFHLVPGFRSGRWFLDTRDEGGVAIAGQIPWLDRGDLAMPLFMARWRLNELVITGDFHAAVVSVPDPSITTVTVGAQTVNEQGYYLYFGNQTRWRGYEVGTVKHAAVKDKNGLAAPFRLILWRGEPADFDAYFNFPSATADTIPPSSPGNLVGEAGGSSVALSWQAATDNVAVVGYGVFRDGVWLGNVAVERFAEDGVPAGAHVYQVDAFDAAGNHSARASVSVIVGEETAELAEKVAELGRRLDVVEAKLARARVVFE